MPRPSRSTLRIPTALMSSFSHWTTVRSFIEAFSTGTSSVSGPLVMTKPPTWIERWRGKPSISSASCSAFCTRGSSPDDARLAQDLGGVPFGARALGHLRQPVDLVEREPERLADLADRQPPAVADHLADHPRPVAPVLAVDVLEHLLAPLVLEVDVDVRRLLALHADEALEEQPHPHRVDRGDLQRVADRRVRRRAAPLAEDPLLAREADDVPEREEVAGEVELLDQAELVLDLPAHLLGHPRRVAERQPLGGERAQVALRGVALGQVLLGELVAERVERVLAGLGDLERAPDRLGEVLEQQRHLPRVLQGPLGVAEERLPRRADGGLVADRGEHVLQRLPPAHVGVHVVVRDERDLEPLREPHRLLDPGLVARREGAREPDVEPPRERLGELLHPPVVGRLGEQRDRAPPVIAEVSPGQPRLALRVGEPAPRESAGRGCGTPRRSARRRPEAAPPRG